MSFFLFNTPVIGNRWLQTLGQTEIFSTILSFIINLFVMTIVFFVAGIIIVGKRRALFSDSLLISLVGTLVGNICFLLFPPIVGLTFSLIIWSLLIRRYYETGWLGALAVAVLALIIYVVVLVVLAFLLGIPFLLLML